MHENYHIEPLPRAAIPQWQRTTTAALLAVEGLDCPSCVTQVRNSLLALTGVVEAQVLPSLGLAHITSNPRSTNIPALMKAVMRAGGDGRHMYTVRLVNGLGVTEDLYV